MRRRSFAILFVLVLGLGGLSFAETGKVNISGRLKLFSSLFSDANPEGRFFSHQAGEFAFRRLEIRLKLAGNFNRRISYSLRFDAFAHAGSIIPEERFPEAGLLGSPFYSEYFELNLYEGFIKVSDFLLKNLDFTVGKQRIQWGTADRVNVVDMLNPIDFANFFTFDPDHAFERRPQGALNLEYHFGPAGKLQLVWLLQHQVSPLPFGYTLLVKSFQGIDDLSVEKGWQETISAANFGVRLSGTVANLDAALCYYKGNLHHPVLRYLSALGDVQAVFLYPGLQMIGADIAGELWGIGFWAEAAYFIPEQVAAKAILPALLDGLVVPLEMDFDLFEKGFFKYVIGADYHFGRGFYANVQYLHGFFDEADFSEESKTFFGIDSGQFFGEIENYIAARLEYTNRSASFKIGIGGLYEMSRQNAFAFMPVLECKIADGMLIQAGGFLVLSGSEQGSKFAMFKRDKILYLGFRLDF